MLSCRMSVFILQAVKGYGLKNRYTTFRHLFNKAGCMSLMPQRHVTKLSEVRVQVRNADLLCHFQEEVFEKEGSDVS